MTKYKTIAVVRTQDERVYAYEAPAWKLQEGDEVIVQYDLHPYTLRGTVVMRMDALPGQGAWEMAVALNHGKPLNKVLRRVMYDEFKYEEEAAEEQTEESEVEANG